MGVYGGLARGSKSLGDKNARHGVIPVEKKGTNNTMEVKNSNGVSRHPKMGSKIKIAENGFQNTVGARKTTEHGQNSSKRHTPT